MSLPFFFFFFPNVSSPRASLSLFFFVASSRVHFLSPPFSPSPPKFTSPCISQHSSQYTSHFSFNHGFVIVFRFFPPYVRTYSLPNISSNIFRFLLPAFNERPSNPFFDHFSRTYFFSDASLLAVFASLQDLEISRSSRAKKVRPKSFSTLRELWLRIEKNLYFTLSRIPRIVLWRIFPRGQFKISASGRRRSNVLFENIVQNPCCHPSPSPPPFPPPPPPSIGRSNASIVLSKSEPRTILFLGSLPRASCSSPPSIQPPPPPTPSPPWTLYRKRVNEEIGRPSSYPHH